MATHKVTWFFEGLNHGWTESLAYVTGLGLAETLKHAKNLAKARVKLLGVECKIKATRVSTEGTGPDALLDYEEFTPDNQEPAAQPHLAVLVRCNDVTNQKWKHMFLRGFWDKVEDNFGNYKRNTAVWKKHMEWYLLKLQVDQWCWMGVANNPKVKLTNYTQDANDRVTYNFAADIFPADRVDKKDYVRISGANGKSRANGYFPVEVIDRRTCVTVTPIAVGAYKFGGFGTYSTKTPVGIATATDQKVVERRSGAPLLEQRGRLKARPRI